jgi:hypothetical protein
VGAAGTSKNCPVHVDGLEVATVAVAGSTRTIHASDSDQAERGTTAPTMVVLGVQYSSRKGGMWYPFHGAG